MQDEWPLILSTGQLLQGRHAAVGYQFGAQYKGRIVRRKEGGYAGNFFGLAKAAYGYLLFNAFAHLL